MPIILDHHLREQITHEHAAYPISFFRDELAALPNHAGPLHWHPDFEIAMAERGDLDFQIGLQHVVLHAGESIFINGNVLHGVKQLTGDAPDPMPNIVFPGTAIASEDSAIYRKYIRPIAFCDTLPYIAFNQKAAWHSEANRLAGNICRQLEDKAPCYEMAIQRELSSIFESIFAHLEELPRFYASRVQMNTQIRIHKMLSFIYERYKDPISLKDIARAANISVSEAGRCFNSYMGCSPIEALIRHRLQEARRLLKDTVLTLQEICYSCGFNSVPYFCRQFKKNYGHSPGQNRGLGK